MIRGYHPRMPRPFAEATIDIDAPLAHVWAVMLDFPRYGEWNPFIVRADLTGPPRIGAALRLYVRWNDGTGATSGERITELTPPTRLAYRFTGPLHNLGLVRATRVQQLEPLATNRTRYSTREDFSGLLTATLPLAKIQDGFDRHAQALKSRAETLDPRPE